MKEEIAFTAKQVGGRVKERRLELNLTMPELGKRIGVNKSTIQRYEADGVDPKRTMIINGLAEALLTTFLGKMIDLYSVLCYHFADAMAEVDRVAADEGLKESLMRYAIESGAITEKVYRNEMEAPIEDMKRFLDGILHIYDEGRTKVSMGELFGIVTAAEERLAEKKKSVAP